MVGGMPIVFDGWHWTQAKEKWLKREVGVWRRQRGRPPRLVAVLVGDNPASRIYLGKKAAAAERIGIIFAKKDFPAETKPEKIVEFIRQLNRDPAVDGIMIQLPLPKNLEIRNWKLEILGAIAAEKDVDCLTPENFGLLAQGKPRFLPATVKAVLEILKIANFSVEGANVVVVGASNIVGKPLALVLSNLGATVTICRSKTKNLGEYTRQADLLVSATGVPGLIKKEMVKKGAVVIDVGSPKGDVDFAEVKKVASFITPVPGGVGPLTVVSLLENTLYAAKLEIEKFWKSDKIKNN